MQQPQNFSLQGAVDLGARQAAAQRRQRAAAPAPAGGAGGGAPGAPGEPGASVIDVTDETFNTDVVARSRAVPVILDLWAEWCGPCNQLSPVLEKLADEADGAWILAKVDVDANPQLSAALQVQSIPMVVAVLGGQVVDGFLGAMPEAQVRNWLAQVMEVAGQMGLPGADGAAVTAAEGRPDAGPGGPAGQGPGMPPGGAGDPLADPAFDEAREAMERGDLNAAAAAFEKLLAATPGHPLATMGLRQVELRRRVNSYDMDAVRRAAAQHPEDAEAQAKAADVELATGQVDLAFDRLLNVVRRTSGDERNTARVRLLELFEIFPPGEPQVSRARATLSSLLF